ncbi:MAG: DUF4139 domain-containing protein [Promethearchaeota archaeon]
MQELEIPIDEVVLQPDNAIIRRRGQLELVEGRNVIDISNLDPNLDPNSLKFIVSGKSLVIHNMKFSTKTIDNSENIATQEALKSENLWKIKEFKAQIQDYEFWLDQYHSLPEQFAERFAQGYAEAKVTIDDYLEVYNFMEAEVTKFMLKKEELMLEIQKLTSENENIDEKIKEFSEEEKKQKRGHLTLILEIEETQTVDVQLEYLLAAGKWNMFYELEHEEDEVFLRKWVTITNTSEEPWSNVNLTLTDKIRSEISIERPQLAYMDPEEGIESDFLIPVQSIHLSSRVTIMNDSEPYKYEIGQEGIKSSRYLYYWNASEFADVIEILIISLKENYLYPATIQVFHDGIFIDSINHMDFTPPSEEIGIPLRPVKTIRTSKEALTKEIEETGVLKKQIELHYSYLLTITNPFDKGIQVVAYEKIPKPQKLENGRDLALLLNVDYEKVSNIPYKVFNNGLVRWDLNLAPKEEKKIDFNIHLVKGD